MLDPPPRPPLRQDVNAAINKSVIDMECHSVHRSNGELPGAYKGREPLF